MGDDQFKTGLGKVNWFFVRARGKRGPVNRDTRPVIGIIRPTGRLIGNNLQRFLLGTCHDVGRRGDRRRVIGRDAVDPVDTESFRVLATFCRSRTAVIESRRPSRSAELPREEEQERKDVITADAPGGVLVNGDR